MKTQSLTTGLALLSAALLLGCQGPTAPEAQPTVELSIVPAAISASGIVVSINQAEKHGMIERDDGSNTLYQFNIPRDTGGITPEVGGVVVFIIDPENSRHATRVEVPCDDGTLPPCDE